MKKAIIAAILILTICCSLGTAFAATSEEHICELALQNEKVLKAECVVYHRACVLAIKTEKFSTRSEYEKFCEDLTQKVKNDCEIEYVVITRSPKVFHKINALNKLPEDKRNELIEDIVNREMAKFKERSF